MGYQVLILGLAAEMLDKALPVLRATPTVFDVLARCEVPQDQRKLHRGWRSQGVPSSFGFPTSRLADAYLQMGCRPTYTCVLALSARRRGERWGVRRLVGIKRGDLRQLGAGRADGEARRLTRPLHRTHRTGAAVGGLSRLQPQAMCRDWAAVRGVHPRWRSH